MTAEDWLDAGTDRLWLPYTQMKNRPPQLLVTGAAGARLHLADGRQLIDGIASWWCAVHGYAHPHIIAALKAQADCLPHVMLGGLAHEQPYRLAARLASLLPGDLNHVFFSESGSVSVEIALKMAVQFHLNRRDTTASAGMRERRTRFVSFKGGYHGDTFATMSVCDPEEGMHTMFRGVVPEQIVVDLPTDEASRTAFAATLERHSDEIAAVIVEPLVQGAGGMLFHDPSVLATLRAETEKRGILLIFDEIFVGFARTGQALFACEAANVLPDIITLSKALTGGTLPLAASVARKHVFEAFLDDDPERALMHGPTYMGNAMACAAANASLDLFASEPRLDQAQAIERHLSARLTELVGVEGVADVRCFGGIGVVELADWVPLGGLAQRFVEEGVFIRPFRNIVYVTPPLVIEEPDLDRLCGAMVRVIPDWIRAQRNDQRARA